MFYCIFVSDEYKSDETHNDVNWYFGIPRSIMKSRLKLGV